MLRHISLITNLLVNIVQRLFAANKRFNVDKGDLHGGLQLQDYPLEGTALRTEISCGKIISKLHRSAVNLRGRTSA